MLSHIKIIMIFIAIFLVGYLGWAVILSYKYSQKYSYTKSEFPLKIATDLIQPFMEVFGNGKATHMWHWENINPDYDYKKYGFKRDSTQVRVFKPQFDLGTTLVNARASLNGIKELIVVKPKNYTGKWTEAYCVNQEPIFCQRSIISFEGAVRILNDGDGYTWGLDESGNPIELEILREIPANEERDILFV